MESDEDECEGSRGAEVRKWTKTRCDECAGTSSVEKALSTWWDSEGGQGEGRGR